MSRHLEPGSVAGELRAVVDEHGPIRAADAVRLVRPGAGHDERSRLCATLATEARRGHIDRIAPGLYDRSCA